MTIKEIEEKNFNYFVNNDFYNEISTDIDELIKEIGKEILEISKLSWHDEISNKVIELFKKHGVEL
jgi:TRAP-type C4-dicarboxylate transport system substrate-binding protein